MTLMDQHININFSCSLGSFGDFGDFDATFLADLFLTRRNYPAAQIPAAVISAQGIQRFTAAVIGTKIFWLTATAAPF